MLHHIFLLRTSIFGRIVRVEVYHKETEHSKGAQGAIQGVSLWTCRYRPFQGGPANVAKTCQNGRHFLQKGTVPSATSVDCSGVALWHATTPLTSVQVRKHHESQSPENFLPELAICGLHPNKMAAATPKHIKYTELPKHANNFSMIASSEGLKGLSQTTA